MDKGSVGSDRARLASHQPSRGSRYPAPSRATAWRSQLRRTSTRPPAPYTTRCTWAGLSGLAGRLTTHQALGYALALDLLEALSISKADPSAGRPF